MKVVTVFGTRPEIIRLSVIIRVLDRFCEHVVIHTGQNYDENLSDVFFKELQLRAPDEHLGVQAPGFAGQVSQLFPKIDEAFTLHRPERLLILGDTNSGLASVVAARRGIPVYHLEAGNRCYDDRVPEEINRRIIDHCSTVLMPYTHRAKENLLREGIERERIFVVGNPIYEVLKAYQERIDASDVAKRLGVKPKEYFLATIHRAENVEVRERLSRLLEGFEALIADHKTPIIVSLHPHTKNRLRDFRLRVNDDLLRLLPPFGYFDFVNLEKNARCVITDSGTVQEECCIFRVPNVTVRDVTERPETLEVGSNMLVGVEPGLMRQAVALVLERPATWSIPPEYVEQQCSSAVAKIVLGYCA